jgi:DNA-binding SARP family transcriptional activator
MDLAISLLGSVEASSAEGQRIALPAGKVSGLLAYLAMLRGEPQFRDTLASLFWEEQDEGHARGSLRFALFVLQQALTRAHCPILVCERDRVWLPAPAVRVDALDFERLVRLDNPEALEQALVLYRGEFLHGLAVRSQAFEDWARSERTRFLNLAQGALETLFRHYEGAGEIDRALLSAHRLLGLDPLREDVHQTLIRLYIRQGRRADALRQFQTCAVLLRRELGVEPEETTRRLVGRLRRSGGTSEGNSAPAVDPGLVAPSIAILPFVLLRPTQEAGLLALILREGLEFALSRFRELRVLVHCGSRRSADILEVEPDCLHAAPDLVVQGSILHDEERFQIKLRLVERRTGEPLWEARFSERWSGRGGSDEWVICRMAAAIHAALECVAPESIHAAAGKRFKGFPLALLGRCALNKLSRSSLAHAVRLAREAQRRDSTCSLAFSTFALARVFQLRMGWSAHRRQALREAADSAAEAMILDYGDAVAHGVSGLVHLWSGAHDTALRSIQRALSLNPNRADLMHWKGLICDFSGEHEAAIACHRTALSMAPHHPAAFATANALAGAYYQLENYAAAAEWARRSMTMFPSYRRSGAVLAAALARLGDERGSTSALAVALGLDPGLSLKRQLSGYVYRNSEEVSAWERGYLRAGMH